MGFEPQARMAGGNPCRLAALCCGSVLAFLALVALVSTWLTCHACHSVSTRPTAFVPHAVGQQLFAQVPQALAATVASGKGKTSPVPDTLPSEDTEMLGVVLNNFKNDAMAADAVLHYSRCACVGAVHLIWGDTSRPLPASFGHMVTQGLSNIDPALAASIGMTPAEVDALLPVPVVPHSASGPGLSERFRPHPTLLQSTGPWAGAWGPSHAVVAATRLHPSMWHVDDDMRFRCRELCSAFQVAQRNPRRMVSPTARQGFCVPHFHRKDGAPLLRGLGPLPPTSPFTREGWWGQAGGDGGDTTLLLDPAGRGQTAPPGLGHCSHHEYTFAPHWLLWRNNHIALTKSAFVPSEFLAEYWATSPVMAAIRTHVAQGRNCEDIAMQMVASHATGLGPVEIRFTSWLKERTLAGEWLGPQPANVASQAGTRVVADYGVYGGGISHAKGHFERRSECVHLFTRWLRDPVAAQVAATATNLTTVALKHLSEETTGEVLVPSAAVAWVPTLPSAVFTPGC